MHHTVARRRIEEALAGTTAMSDLSDDERAVMNSELDASIQAHARATSYGELVGAEGIATVALDDDGNLVEYEPDGSATTIG